MSIKKTKLGLRTETLRTLTSPELEAAAGGAQFPTVTLFTCPSRCAGLCPPSVPLCIPTVGCK